jgi:hypothetical protein
MWISVAGRSASPDANGVKPSKPPQLYHVIMAELASSMTLKTRIKVHRYIIKNSSSYTGVALVVIACISIIGRGQGK